MQNDFINTLCEVSFVRHTANIRTLPPFDSYMTVVSDFRFQSTLEAVYVYVVPWSEFPIVPSYPYYLHPVRVPHLCTRGRKLRILNVRRCAHLHSLEGLPLPGYSPRPCRQGGDSLPRGGQVSVLIYGSRVLCRCMAAVYCVDICQLCVMLIYAVVCYVDI